MQTVAGKVYQVSLVLSGVPTGETSWLVAALSSVYPGVEVLDLQEQLDGGTVEAYVRWTKTGAVVEPGQVISADIPGVLMTKGIKPTAIVQAIAEVEAVPETGAARIAVPLIGAVGILALTVWLSKRITRSMRLARAHG
jgi:hypothetical protein